MDLFGFRETPNEIWTQNKQTRGNKTIKRPSS